MDAISLKVDANGIGLDFTAMDALLDAKKLSNPQTAFTDLLELNKYTGDKLKTSGWDGVEKIITWTADLEANNINVNALLTEFGYRTPTAGNDTLNGDSGNDVIDGGDGNDTIIDASGWNTLKGGAGNDTVTGHGVLEGGAGDDTLVGSGGSYSQ